MKYVPGEQRLQALLQQWGLARFDPFRLSAEQTEVAVRFMQGEADAAVTAPGELDEFAATPPQAKKQPALASLPTAKTLKQSPHSGKPVATAERKTLGIVVLAATGILCSAGISYLLLK